MMSGMRNEPPISISSPRETGTSRPSASVLRINSTAAALLFTTVAASAPVISRSRRATCSSRSPRLPVARSNSSVVAPASASAAASAASRGSSARPRLVCSTVPVRLNTGRCEAAQRRTNASAAASRIAPGSAGNVRAARQGRQLGPQRSRHCCTAEPGEQQIGLRPCATADQARAVDWWTVALRAMLRRMSTTFEIPTLRTERLLLRAFRAADLDAFAAMQANPEVRRFLGTGNLLSRTETWGLMERVMGQWPLLGYGMFAVETEGRCAGWTGVLHPLEWPEPELAYTLDQPFWGRGLASEAARMARDWAFAQHGFSRLASFILPGNARSIRVAEKLGAVREGTVDLRGFQAEWWVHRSPGHGPVV